MCLCAKFDQFLPVRSHFDTKRPVNLVSTPLHRSAPLVHLLIGISTEQRNNCLIYANTYSFIHCLISAIVCQVVTMDCDHNWQNHSSSDEWISPLGQKRKSWMLKIGPSCSPVYIKKKPCRQAKSPVVKTWRQTSTVYVNLYQITDSKHIVFNAKHSRTIAFSITLMCKIYLPFKVE